MSEIICYQRQKQVLMLLDKHGLLSIRGIEAMLEPEIKRQRLVKVLSRLKKRGLITARYDQLFGGAGKYYQLRRTKQALREVAASIGKQESEILPPVRPHAQLIHGEACAVWAERLKMFFPQARVLQEHEIHQDPTAMNVLLIGREDKDVRPDILLCIPVSDGKGQCFIAFEIERTAKAKRRLNKKLRKYAAESKLDGVVYVCADESLVDTLRDIYVTRIHGKVLRVRHFGDHFFMFSTLLLPARNEDPMLANTKLQTIPLKNWIQTLTKTECAARRDIHFEAIHSLPRL